jgi:rhodanese-related sulfurtransferase
LLRDAGFRNLRVLRGGMERWNQNSLPIEGRAGLEQT